MEEIALYLVQTFKSLSYLGIMLSLTLEFIPAELVLPLSGYWVSEGDFNLYLTILAGTIGGVLGPLTLYALGRYGGRPMVEKYGKFFLIKEKHINKADIFFNKYGAGVAFFGRFLPVVRTSVSIPCGMMKMNVWKFSIYTFLAMLPITSLYVYLGFKLGSHWENVVPIAKEYMQPIVIVIVLFISIYFVYRYISRNKHTV